jgi:BMFP domain-containing protein YqiC
MSEHLTERFFAELRRRVPQGLGANIENNVRAALTAAFERFDLVTREELEVQEAVLQRTRERLAEMEKRLTELEARIK